METRQRPRVNATLKVATKIDEDLKQSIKLAKGNYFEAVTYDISASGIGVIVKYFLPEGLVVNMEIEGAPFDLSDKMRLKGKIRHCNYIKPHSYKCGIKFLNPPEKYQKIIAQFVSRYDKRGKSRLNLPT